MDNILDPNETVIWSDKPKKKAYLLKAFGGIPFALIFSFGVYFMITYGAPSGIEWFLPIFMICWIIGLIVVPPIWYFRKSQVGVEYMMTNQRLLIKSGITKQDVWFTDLDNIKDAVVKIGLFNKIMGTGRLYPITAEYPYEPKLRAYSEGGMNRLRKVYNIVEQKYDEKTELELYRHDQTRPCLEALTEPYAVQKLLKEAIFGAGTNYVNCEYCKFRYDLNKEGKCPHCGGTQSHKYSSI